MFICTFNVANQRLRRYTSGVIFAGSYPNTIFKFNFNTPDWDLASIRTAVFSCHGANYFEPLDENNMCKVPTEVLREGYFQVSIHGGGIVTNMVRVPVAEAYKDADIDDGGNCSCADHVVFVPEIDDKKILSWTVQKVNGDLTPPSPTDLNPYDEWINDETVSEYVWEEE